MIEQRPLALVTDGCLLSLLVTLRLDVGNECNVSHVLVVSIVLDANILTCSTTPSVLALIE